MNKIAAYEIALSGNYLWDKEAASRVVESYRRGKPLLEAVLNARTPTEVQRLGGQYKAHRLSSLGRSGKLGKDLSHHQFSRQFQDLERRSR